MFNIPSLIKFKIAIIVSHGYLCIDKDVDSLHYLESAFIISVIIFILGNYIFRKRYA